MRVFYLLFVVVAIARAAAVPYYVHLNYYTHFATGSRRLDSQHTSARRGHGSIFEQVETYDHDGKLVTRGVILHSLADK